MRATIQLLRANYSPLFPNFSHLQPRRKSSFSVYFSQERKGSATNCTVVAENCRLSSQIATFCTLSTRIATDCTKQQPFAGRESGSDTPKIQGEKRARKPQTSTESAENPRGKFQGQGKPPPFSSIPEARKPKNGGASEEDFNRLKVR